MADPALAEEDAGDESIVLTHRIRDTYITVVASGMNDRITATGQPVSIIGKAEIDSVQGPDLTRILQRTPGVTISRNGGVGGFTGVRVRGAEAEQLLVVIDGVRVADRASPGGGFDFGNLLPGAISKLELLRGSNSVIWGSQAIGGVLAVTSAQADDLSFSAEYGARGSFYGRASGGLSSDAGSLAFDGGYFRTDGFSTAASGTEPDGFRQWQIGGRGRLDINHQVSLIGSARYSDGRLDIDGFPAPLFTLADTAEYQDTREFFALTGAELSFDDVSVVASLSFADIERDSFDPLSGADPSFSTDGRSERAELRSKWDLDRAFSLRLGGEYERTRFSSTFDTEKRANIGGAYGQLSFDHEGKFLINAGARLDDHSRFGSAVTFGADAAFELGSDWRLRTSFGEGFKAPTLFQLFSDFGNQTLAAERSTSFDVGLDYGDRNLDEFLALSIFRRDSENQIDFISCSGMADAICTDRPFGTYQNIRLTRAQGVEVEGGMAISDDLAARAVYAFIDTENRTSGSANEGNSLARRPRHAATLSADWTPQDFRFGGDFRLVSRSFDDAAGSVRIGGYAVLDLRASWQVTDTFELFGRVENVWDEHYQTAAGFGTAGRGVFAGVRAAM
ncbi:TonB-dependent receptor plug domain-containing protein [Allopontixanthobacter sp.]|uniref:TonB-dependent receptor plug domain-containing protein n=1 Tax=Allopontixanthobacter sp. TaxID=2906452 RepID=UPI002ABAEF32|nr:TonB-dependent receptor [Allopontixanthobacter sp.]MDZ4306290.1 TonB-dependent receptor [Allopontixanthobacter sp.]